MVYEKKTHHFALYSSTNLACVTLGTGMVAHIHYISLHEKLAGPTEEEHMNRATATCTLRISEQRMPNLVCEPLQSI